MKVEVQTEGIRQNKTLSDFVERTARLAFGSLSERTRFIGVSLSRSQSAHQETCCHVFVFLKISDLVFADDAGVDLEELVRGALRRAAASARCKLREIEIVAAWPQSSVKM